MSDLHNDKVFEMLYEDGLYNLHLSPEEAEAYAKTEFEKRATKQDLNN